MLNYCKIKKLCLSGRGGEDLATLLFAPGAVNCSRPSPEPGPACSRGSRDPRVLRGCAPGVTPRLRTTELTPRSAAICQGLGSPARAEGTRALWPRCGGASTPTSTRSVGSVAADGLRPADPSSQESACPGPRGRLLGCFPTPCMR